MVEITGLEGERAERSEVKTVRWTVCSERAAEALNFPHAASSVADGIGS